MLHVPVHIATASRHHHTSAAGNFCLMGIVSNAKSYLMLVICLCV